MLILFVVVVGVVAALAVAGVTVASGEGRPERSFFGGAGLSLLVLVGVVAVVVLGAAAVGLVGLRGGGGGEDEPAAARPADPIPAIPETAPAPPAPPVAEPVGNQPTTPEGSPLVKPEGAGAVPAAAGPEVAISSGAPGAVVDRLPDRAVLVVTARGFKPGPGQVAQCAAVPERPPGCVNRFPVEFDGDGTARFQYLVSDRVGSAGRCGAGQAPCLVVVFGSQGEPRGSAFTVFHDPAPPPGRVTVEPRTGLSGGDEVTVVASGFPPATRLVATQCPPGPAVDPGRCRGTASARTGPDGGAVLRLTMRTGEVGGVDCGPRRPCSVRLVADAPVAPVTVPVTFSAGPSARYHGGRLAAGLALAALLLALAWRLVRITDWREPAAASTPEMDRAVLDA